MSMQDIPVKNKELLAILNLYRDFLVKDIKDFEKTMHLQCREEISNRDWWIGKAHLKEILDQKTSHEGFPDVIIGYECTVARENHEFFSKNASPISRKERTLDLSNASRSIMSWLNVRNTALTAYYPPGGLISWHNNANAAAYNLIFTWSQTGDGYFQYVHPETKEIVVMKDRVGWQCKAAYFGHYGEPERLFYHSASTNCWRCTVSFTFDTTNTSAIFREEILEEISSE